MAHEIVLGANLGGVSAYPKSVASVSGPEPSPDPRYGWATEWIIVDATTEEIVPETIGEGLIGSGLIGIRSVKGAAPKPEDFSAWVSTIRATKGAHETVPQVFFFLRDRDQRGANPIVNEQARPALTSWTANDMARTLTIDVGE